MGLNPIFNSNLQKKSSVPKTHAGSSVPPLIGNPPMLPRLQEPIVHGSSTAFPQDKAAKKSRQVRSDKKDDIKFPVTDAMLEALTRSYRIYKKRHRGELFETGYHTLLLEKALMKDVSMFPEVPYQDTKMYKHVNLVQFYSDKVFELALKWKCSQRKAIFRIMYTLVERNELL
ncbi:hypothetical protein [Paenibacillus cremeus]|uniref:Uncharacterized protein n=1 Tax=Paenibacillus cremeus TaxID=2163881 RepID=A0A559K5D1_9BACL|nr:hypothetical protein [Paenibacillus cremeus]TVY07307.1 hypothetical protein FPZ49_24500 [Paenibacillus cremeus]